MTAPATSPPVRWDVELGAFRVVGFEEAWAVLCGAGWSSDPRLGPLATAATREMPTGSLIFSDPPQHTRLRRLLSPAFTPRAIERLRPRVAAIVDEVLDGLPALDPGIDVLYDVGYPIPLAVVAELLDVGTEGAKLFADQTADLVRILEPHASSAEHSAAATAATEVMLFLTPILAERRRDLGKDFISALLTAPGGLSLDEVMSTCVLLLAAGHETTANLVTTATRELLLHPGQVPHLLADPAAGGGGAVAHHRPGDVGRPDRDRRARGRRHPDRGRAGGRGRRPAGQPGPSQVPDPDRMDLTRQPTGHLAFGAGLHFCLGAALARLAAAETLSRLFSRYPNLALTDTPARWRRSFAFHALTELPVRLAG